MKPDEPCGVLMTCQSPLKECDRLLPLLAHWTFRRQQGLDIGFGHGHESAYK